MRAALDTIASLLTGGRCHQRTQTVHAALAERYAPASANLMLSALRGVLKEAWLLGQLTAEEYQRAANLKTVGGETLPRGRALAPGELRALFRVCAEDRRPAGARDAALIAALYGGGLRRSEVVALLLAAYDPTHQALTARWAFSQRCAHYWLYYRTNRAAGCGAPPQGRAGPIRRRDAAGGCTERGCKG